MPKKLDPDYEPPTDEQIAAAVDAAKKTFSQHDQRLREKLSQIVPAFDSADDKDWIRLAVSLTKQLGTDWTAWQEMPISKLLDIVDAMVHDRYQEMVRDRDRYQGWKEFVSLQSAAKYLKSKGRPTGKTTVDSWLRRGKPWVVRYGKENWVYLDLNHSEFNDLEK